MLSTQRLHLHLQGIPSADNVQGDCTAITNAAELPMVASKSAMCRVQARQLLRFRSACCVEYQFAILKLCSYKLFHAFLTLNKSAACCHVYGVHNQYV